MFVLECVERCVGFVCVGVCSLSWTVSKGAFVVVMLDWRGGLVLFVLQCVERCVGVGVCCLCCVERCVCCVCVGMGGEVRWCCLCWNVSKGALVLECVALVLECVVCVGMCREMGLSCSCQNVPRGASVCVGMCGEVRWCCLCCNMWRDTFVLRVCTLSIYICRCNMWRDAFVSSINTLSIRGGYE